MIPCLGAGWQSNIPRARCYNNPQSQCASFTDSDREDHEDHSQDNGVSLEEATMDLHILCCRYSSCGYLVRWNGRRPGSDISLPACYCRMCVSVLATYHPWVVHVDRVIRGLHDRSGQKFPTAPRRVHAVSIDRCASNSGSSVLLAKAARNGGRKLESLSRVAGAH